MWSRYRGTNPDIPFDPLLRANTTELRQAIKVLAVHLESAEKALQLRKRARKDVDRPKFRLAVEALACNLCRMAASAPDSALAVPRGNDTMWSKGRRGGAVYGQHFRDLLNLMVHAGVGLAVIVKKGYRGSDDGPGECSTIRPTSSLTDRFSGLAMGYTAYRQKHDESEVLVLHGPKPPRGKAPNLPYRDTDKRKRARVQVQRINAYLIAAPIIIAAPDGFLGLDDKGQPIDPNRRAVRRIFNNGRWDEGGRLYDGFWETMPKVRRRELLRIGTKAHPEGEPIKNADFDQLYPRLAYLVANVPAPSGDLYEIPGMVGERIGWKRIMNALLFAKRPMKRWPRECLGSFPKGAKLKDTIAALKAKHGPIAHLFETDVGPRLMFFESQVLVTALLILFRMGITALPLHDSVLVARSDAETAKSVLQEAYERNLGQSRAPVSIA